jgi:hypothetical protein
MRIDDINIESLNKNDMLDRNTSFLVASFTRRYLIQVSNNIYKVDIRKFTNNASNHIEFINNFIPTGHIYLNDNTQYFSILLANKNIIQTSNQYKKIGKNQWVGYYKNSDNIFYSLGVLVSIEHPREYIPVFPKRLINNCESPYYNIFTSENYGYKMLNMNKMGGKKLSIITIDGDIKSLTTPVEYSDLHDESTNHYQNHDKKIFFSTQGDIVINSNCIHPINNLAKYELDECNAVSEPNNYHFINTNVDSNKDNNNDDNNDDNDVNNNENKNNNKRGISLREHDEPWYKNYDIFGKYSQYEKPHKITGIKPVMDNDIIVNKKMDKVIENFNDGDENTFYDENMIIIIITIIVIIIFYLNR